MTQDQIKAILRQIPSERNRLMVLVAFLHGLRASETVALTGKDIQDGHVNVQRKKGSFHTIQPFVVHPDPELNEAPALMALAARLRPDERLFPMTRYGFWDLMKRSCGMVVIKEGIEHARQYLGHKSIASTGAYVRVSDATASEAFKRALSR
jgi:integrase